MGRVQNCKPDVTEVLVERNGVGGDTAVRKVGGWAGDVRVGGDEVAPEVLWQSRHWNVFG